MVGLLSPFRIDSSHIFCTRIGAPGLGRPRPLKVVLRSSADALTVLRSGRRLGEFFISPDRTSAQREYFSNLRDTVRQYNQSNPVVKRGIRYLKGRPTICDVSGDRRRAPGGAFPGGAFPPPSSSSRRGMASQQFSDPDFTHTQQGADPYLSQVNLGAVSRLGQGYGEFADYVDQQPMSQGPRGARFSQRSQQGTQPAARPVGRSQPWPPLPPMTPVAPLTQNSVARSRIDRQQVVPQGLRTGISRAGASTSTSTSADQINNNSDTRKVKRGRPRKNVEGSAP